MAGKTHASHGACRGAASVTAPHMTARGGVGNAAAWNPSLACLGLGDVCTVRP